MADLSDYYITVDSDKDEDISSDEDSVYSSSTTSSSCDQLLTVYVGKFPPFINEGQLRSHFQQYSQSITKVTIVRDKETKSSKGFAFIYFNSDEVADRAIISLNHSKLLDKYVINVRNKKEQYSRKGRGQPRQPLIKVWVGNISPDTTKEDLSLHFAIFKENMKPIRDLLQSKGSKKSSSQFAFLFFTSLKSAQKAILTMNGTMLKKRKLCVQLSESKKKQLNPLQSSPSDISKDPFITKDSISKTKPVVLKTLSTSTVITLTNVASEIDDSELEALIEGHGTVISVKSNDIGNGTRKALITLANSEEAVKVAKELNGQTFFGKIMSVKVGTLSTKDVVKSNVSGEKTKQNLISISPSSPLQQKKKCVNMLSIVNMLDFLISILLFLNMSLFSPTNSSTQPPFNQPLLPLSFSPPLPFGIAPVRHRMHPQSNSNEIKLGPSPEASTYPLHQPLTQCPSHQGNTYAVY